MGETIGSVIFEPPPVLLSLASATPREELDDRAQTLRATAVLVGLAIAGAPFASADPQPTLGRVWAPSVRGYGTVRPARVFNGGDPTGDIWDITWSSWGGEQATGAGTSYWVPPGAGVAGSVKEPATIVAYNLGTCDGQLMYQAAAEHAGLRASTSESASLGMST